MTTNRVLWIAGTVSVLVALSAAASAQFTRAPGSPITGGSQPESLTVGDFNGDGKLDLAIANSVEAGTVTVLLGNGTGGFTAAPGSPFPVGRYPESVAVGDFNGDGKPDLAIGNGSGREVAVLLGDGKGGFTAAAGSPFPAESHNCSVAVGDFNRDGKPDLAIANGGSDTVTVLLNSFSGSATASPAKP